MRRLIAVLCIIGMLSLPVLGYAAPDAVVSALRSSYPGKTVVVISWHPVEGGGAVSGDLSTKCEATCANLGDHFVDALSRGESGFCPSFNAWCDSTVTARSGSAPKASALGVAASASASLGKSDALSGPEAASTRSYYVRFVGKTGSWSGTVDGQSASGEWAMPTGWAFYYVDE